MNLILNDLRSSMIIQTINTFQFPNQKMHVQNEPYISNVYNLFNVSNKTPRH